jgi:hypothetical protein
MIHNNNNKKRSSRVRGGKETNFLKIQIKYKMKKINTYFFLPSLFSLFPFVTATS